MRRWRVRCLAIVAIVIALIAITAHFVLRSDWPRQIVIDRLQRETGLRIEAGDLRTGWSGETTVRDVTLTLPLEIDPFVRVREIRVRHTALLWLLFTGSINVGELAIHDPHVMLRVDSDGQWNFVKAASLITQTQDRHPADGGTMFDALPHLRISNAVVDVQAPNGRMIRYEPLVVRGDSDGGRAWRFVATLEPKVRLEGRLSPTAGWAHEIDFDVDQVYSIIAPWLPDAPQELRLAGRWSGQIRDAVLSGRLELDDLRAAPISMRGMVNVEVTGLNVAVELIDLTTTIDDTAIKNIRLTGGQLHIDTTSLRAQRLLVNSDDLRARIDAQWNLADETGNATIEWTSDGTIWPIEQTGRLAATLSRTAHGRFDAHAALQASGVWKTIRFNADMDVHGTGENWRNLHGAVVVNRLQADEPRAMLRLDGATAKMQLSWPELLLDDLHLPNATAHSDKQFVASGNGRINFDTRQWSSTFEARRWQPPAQYKAVQLPPADVTISATGDLERAHVQSFSLRAGDIEIDGMGTLAFQALALTWKSQVRAAPIRLPDGLTIGAINTNMVIDGTLVPVRLNVAGRLTADQLTYQSAAIDQLALAYQGEVTEQRIGFMLHEAAMFGGTWRTNGSLDLTTMIASIDLHAEAAKIEALTALINMPVNVSGIISASLKGEIPLHAPLSGDLAGSWTLRDGAGVGFENIHGQGMVRFHEKTLDLHDLQLHDREGTLTGNAAMQLDRPHQLQAAVVLSDWTWVNDRLELSASIHGSTTMKLDLLTADGFGELALEIDLLQQGEPIGSINLEATLDAKQLTLSRLDATAHNATVSGPGFIVFDPDHWMDSRLTVSWSDLELALLGRVSDLAAPIRGVSSGELTIRHDDSPRAIEPMRMDVTAFIHEGSFREVPIGRRVPTQPSGPDRAGFQAALNFSPQRLVLNHAAITALGGDIRLSGRISQHDGVPLVHMNIKFDDLDIQQVVSATELTTNPMPGRVSGSASIGGYLHRDPRLFGQATLQLSQSDLITLPAFALLFEALGMQRGTSSPTGVGKVDVRLEGNALQVSRLRYFNRGADITAQLRIDNVFQGKTSEIRGLAVGVVRPLANINLPYLDMFDRLIKAVQMDAASVLITGTVGDPQQQVVPLREATGALNRLISGRVD